MRASGILSKSSIEYRLEVPGLQKQLATRASTTSQLCGRTYRGDLIVKQRCQKVYVELALICKTGVTKAYPRNPRR